MTTITDPGTPGYVLRNGAILLDEKDAVRQRGGMDCTVILAFAPGAFQPFCVWSRHRTRTPLADLTFDGDYHTSIDDAVAAYKLREV